MDVYVMMIGFLLVLGASVFLLAWNLGREPRTAVRCATCDQPLPHSASDDGRPRSTRRR